MARKKDHPQQPDKPSPKARSFHLEFKNTAQKVACSMFEQHDILFMIGPAGTGKTLLATAFAIGEIVAKRKRKIILTRPIVEAGENLGFLPGDFAEKVGPYMTPMFDSIERCVGPEGPDRERVDRSIEIAPVAYLRGRTFLDSVCIFDEAQNATLSQLKLFLTRLGENSKMIITGDPSQTDLRGNTALSDVVNKLKTVPGVGIVEFKANSIVRHPLISAILEKLD